MTIDTMRRASKLRSAIYSLDSARVTLVNAGLSPNTQSDLRKIINALRDELDAVYAQDPL